MIAAVKHTLLNIAALQVTSVISGGLGLNHSAGIAPELMPQPGLSGNSCESQPDLEQWVQLLSSDGPSLLRTTLRVFLSPRTRCFAEC